MDDVSAWDVVRQIMRDKGKTQRQVSRTMGLSDNYLSRKLAEGSSPSVQTLSRVLRSVGGWHVAIINDDGSRVYRLDR